MPDLTWHYGPTETDPDPRKRWHVDCGGEVLYFDDGSICRRCDQQDGDEERTAEQRANYLALKAIAGDPAELYRALLGGEEPDRG